MGGGFFVSRSWLPRTQTAAMTSQDAMKTRRSSRTVPTSPVPPTTTITSSPKASKAVAPFWLVISAFAAVYLIWGSTYLGIHIAIQTIPPFLMAGSRFVIAGAMLYGVMRLLGAQAPSRSQWGSATIIGGLLLAGGNGGVSWAQQHVPTGISALIVAAVPLWIVIGDWIRPRGTKPTASIMVGLLTGFLGVTLIIVSRNSFGELVVDRTGATVLVLSTVAWAAGSIIARYAPRPGSALLFIAMQMLAGGVIQLLCGAALGEIPRFHWDAITIASAWAFVYLTLVGSLIGFTAYVWLLEVSTPAKVSSYAYVNPFVAVILGYLVLSEPLPHQVILAGGLILTAVILLTRASRVKRSVASKSPA